MTKPGGPTPRGPPQLQVCIKSSLSSIPITSFIAISTRSLRKSNECQIEFCRSASCAPSQSWGSSSRSKVPPASYNSKTMKCQKCPGRPACAECFVCSECKTSLRNIGHISVGDKMFCQGCANKAMQAQAPSGGPPPQGLAANLAKLAARPQGPQGPSVPRDPNGCNMGAPQDQGLAPGDWGRRLDADGAGAASNAEEFTKQFMQQLTGGH